MHVRSAVKIKCDRWNKTQTVACTETCISMEFSAYILPIRKHFSMGSYHRRKSAANWSSITKCLTPPKVVLIASWVSLMAYSRFFSMVNTKYTAEDRSGENSAFLRAWVLSPTNKVCTTAAESTSDLEPHRQLFHQPQFLMQKAKNSVNRTWWTWARPSTVTRHPSQCVDGDSGEKIWGILNFLWNSRFSCWATFLLALILQIIRFIV